MTLADRLAAAARRLDGVSEHPSQFTPMRAWWIDGREFAHVRTGTVTVRLTRPEISKHRHLLRSDPRITLNRADWVDVRLRRAGDVPLALRLMRLAADANRRRAGELAAVTPDDRALARRRRLHAGKSHDLDAPAR